ncbi:hypothetical protein WB66_23560 [bacteria symbiont BFo1 of Frankliniella occidentalis]|uniref:hypothetical protein n=1 Tax=Erwinia TaxID=551 RepID=UPI000664551A|nr:MULTISPECIES: hypothetical protein [Erwinia]KMV67531.1 hypothetical protein AI28_14440 [bacteria symbiont BFo1 of Frankliniella occidentalis]KYP82378.1 hypothetical protein WB66_23560 [bacteria symbiont BFo1 of Frankliniella occidentalis]KYP87041.1 hypothetical protein WB91_22310 [bacteria symbiont BFo1 of Frankliniella occidentalis]MDI3440230.1 hypothetical protein [Erwinia sp. V90_4]CAH0296473.1 hypothetical protein SRABI13_04235 [Erwinia aphidicola]
MSTKANEKDCSKNKYSNNVYIAAEPRKKLEEYITEVGYQRKKTIAASAFVRYLIEEFGEQAKQKLIKKG